MYRSVAPILRDNLHDVSWPSYRNDDCGEQQRLIGKRRYSHLFIINGFKQPSIAVKMQVVAAPRTPDITLGATIRTV